jgi:hypothetical protein
LDPIFVSPNTLKEEPILANDRLDKFEFENSKLSMLEMEPILVRPKTETEEPQRVQLRTDNEDPKET